MPTATPISISQIRSQFPALQSGFIYLENAGGSQVPASVPEAMHEYIKNLSLGDMRELLPKLDPETRGALSRSILEDALNSGRDAVSGRYDPHAALEALAKLDKDGPKSKLLFGENAATVKASLEQIAKLQELGGKGFGQYRAGIQMLEIAPLVVAAVTGHGAASMGMAATEFGSARALASLITNPKTALKTLVALRRIAQGGAKLTPLAIDEYRGETTQMPPNMKENDQRTMLGGRQ